MDWLELAALTDAVIDSLEMMAKHGTLTLIGTFVISIIPMIVFHRASGRPYFRRALKTTIGVSAFFAAVSAILGFTFVPIEEQVYWVDFMWFILLAFLLWPTAAATLIVDDASRFVALIRSLTLEIDQDSKRITKTSSARRT